MSGEILVKNIKVIKNNTRPVDTTFFPNLDIREQVITGKLASEDKRYIMIQSYIPIIRGDVYLGLLVHRYEDFANTPTRKKEYVQRFLQEANLIQQRYIVQEKYLPIGEFGEPLIYKMEY